MLLFNNIVFVAYFDRIFEDCGFCLTTWINIFDDYFERMLVRCDCTEISNIEYKISIACLSDYIFYVFIRVYPRIDMDSLSNNGVFYYVLFVLVMILYIVNCNCFNIPLLRIAPILIWSIIILIIINIPSIL